MEDKVCLTIEEFKRVLEGFKWAASYWLDKKDLEFASALEEKHLK